MALALPSIETALQTQVLAGNPSLREDYAKVLSFIQLKGRPSRPIDSVIRVRAQQDFDLAIRMLPEQFFAPFNRLLELVQMTPMRIEPNREAIDVWNNHEFLARLLSNTTQLLDSGRSPALVPRLVSVFLNLEQEEVPDAQEWSTLTAIAIPGSRTYDRAAEGFRAYLRSNGNALLITSGRAPYYDPANADIELTESEANAAYLRILGVPASRICTESESADTTENAEFLAVALRHAAAESGQSKHRLLLVTSPFHIARYRLSVRRMVEEQGLSSGQADIQIDRVFAVGAKASRYWAETYFLTDAKAGYTREATMGVVFNEYLKIAFDLCTQGRQIPKDGAPR